MQLFDDDPATTGFPWRTRRGSADARPVVRIFGPRSCRATDPPPRFTVEAGRAVLFMVEMAEARRLMTSIADRTPDNYFYGGDVNGGFAVDREWSVPHDVWRRLGRCARLYYRVVAFDQVAGESALSVDDRNLHLLPVLWLVAGLN